MLTKEEIETFDGEFFSIFVCLLMKEKDKYRYFGKIIYNSDETSDIDSDFSVSSDEDTFESEEIFIDLKLCTMQSKITFGLRTWRSKSWPSAPLIWSEL